jgi:hypothetical protein
MHNNNVNKNIIILIGTEYTIHELLTNIAKRIATNGKIPH